MDTLKCHSVIFQSYQILEYNILHEKQTDKEQTFRIRYDQHAAMMFYLHGERLDPVNTSGDC